MGIGYDTWGIIGVSKKANLHKKLELEMKLLSNWNPVGRKKSGMLKGLILLT